MDENINIEDEYYDENAGGNPWPHALKPAMPLIVLLFGGPFVLVLLIIFFTYVVTHGNDFKASTASTINFVYVFFGLCAASVLGFIGQRLLRNMIAGWGDLGDARGKHAEARLKKVQAEIAEMQARVIPIGERAVAVIGMDGEIEVHPLVDEREVYQHKIVEADREEQKQIEAPMVQPPLLLPEKILMLDVIRKWPLTLDNLFLGLTKGSKEIGCSLEGFMHVAHDAPTGMGKTSQTFAEIVQLLKLGVRVILANPHFAPVTKKGEDWRPIAQAIENQGTIEVAPGVHIYGLIRSYERIAKILQWLSQVEIDRRFRMQLEGDYSYTTFYIFIDEWPAIVHRYPEAATHLVDVIQRGRAVEVCVDVNAQGFLQEDIDLRGSARENFNTAFHMGGSVYSGAKLLDMPVKDMNALLKVEQVALGKGIGLLRNNEACAQAQLVRLPYAENTYVYYMLGRADNWIVPELRSERNVSGNFRNEAVSRKISGDFRNVIETDAEPVPANVSTFRKTETLVQKVPVPPETRNEILRLRNQGFNRTQIRDAMHFNGEQFKMIKQVLDDEGL